MRKTFLLIFSLALTLLLFGCNGNSEDKKTEEKGKEESTNVSDELKIAIATQPPTLDAHMTTSTVSLDVARNIFEQLVTLNEDYQPTPMLAKSVEVSEDGLTYIFPLREGVLFHNGKEMTSEDVVASMNRWLELSSQAKTLLADAKFEASGTYEVQLLLKEPAADALDVMAMRGQFSAIMPKEIIEDAPSEGVEELIGTGPYQFEEWKQDQYIQLTAFEDYQTIDEPASGLAGKKEAFIENVYYYIISDPATRFAGLQTGEYHIADSLPADNYEQIKSMDNVEVHTFLNSTLNMFYNKKEGIMTDAKMRQAVNIALDMDAIMLASFAFEDLYLVDASLMNPEQINWASEAGSESFNQKDIEKSKQLLAEAGYDGETVKILVTRDYDTHYRAAVVVKEQLEKTGIKVDLEVYDWATLLDRRDDPSTWDLFFTGTGYPSTPVQLNAILPDYAGWTDDPKITALIKEIRTAKSHDQAKASWDELQGFLWNEYVPSTIFGHSKQIIGSTDNLADFEVFQGAIPWNTKITK